VARKKPEARKEQILSAAERVFAEKGFQHATISEVAREAGLSDATIYEYFPTKEELLFSIPLETTQKGKETMALHLEYIRGAANKIRSIIYGYMRFYQNHPDYASVALLILKQNREFLKTEAYQVVREWSREIVRVVEEGIATGEFKADTNPFLIRSVVLGTIEHSVISWLLLGRPANLVELVDPLTDVIVHGIIETPDPQHWNLKISLEPPARRSRAKTGNKPTTKD
jgi:AcrR family transcriptional regulator